MTGILVSASTGVMNSLLGKLATLMGEEFAKLKNLRKEVKFIRDELTGMKDALEGLSYLDELDPQTKRWRDIVREMSYDIEDIIDDFMQNIGESNKTTGFVNNTIERLKTLWARHKIAGEIKDIKKLVLETSARRERYKLDAPPPRNVAIDPRVTTLYENAANLVGVEAPTDELVNLLADDDKQLKMVSIVGLGGLGKTTLANMVYGSLKGKFNQCAFVTVSQKPDIPKLLHSLRSQLSGRISSHDSQLNVILDQLREHLQQKRYLIVIDDLWDVQEWDVIKCAFPENNLGSRVIVTTRIQVVAKACCSNRRDYILRMKPLSIEDSRRLFLGRIFGSEEACPQHLRDVSLEILNRCGGLPLAIISISSMLSSECSNQKERWEHVRDSLGSESNITLERMRQILNFSYKDLPAHLRSCFLYLGMYPEDYMIDRSDLELQWIAEGFISKENGQDVDKVARNYFNQLVNRSLIQPVDFDKGGSVTSCRVHDVFLDLILIKAAEENFFTIVGNSQPIIELGCKIRRLSVRMDFDSSMVVPRNITLAQVRSLMVFGNCQNPPSLSEFKYLRVLRTTGHSGTYVGLCKLQHLRYVRISARHWGEQAIQFSVLQHLETLHLSHVEKYWLQREELEILGSYGIGNIKSLQHLIGFDIARNTLDNINYLGELSNLRYLVLECSSDPEDWEKRMAALRSSLGRLINLENLVITGTWEAIDDLLPLSPAPPPYRLQTLIVPGATWFSIVPCWMGALRNLCELQCMVLRLLNDGVGILAELPLLTHLYIRIASGYHSEMVVIREGRAFKALECLNIDIRHPPLNLTFQAGAMPKLQRLSLKFNGRLWPERSVPPAGIEHLLALEEFSAEISCRESDETCVESAFRSAVAMHPSHPRFGIKFSPNDLASTSARDSTVCFHGRQLTDNGACDETPI